MTTTHGVGAGEIAQPSDDLTTYVKRVVDTAPPLGLVQRAELTKVMRHLSVGAHLPAGTKGSTDGGEVGA